MHIGWKRAFELCVAFKTSAYIVRVAVEQVFSLSSFNEALSY